MKVTGDFTCDVCGAAFDSNVEIASHVSSQHESLSKAEIISELRRIADQLGRAPTMPEFNANAEMTSGAVQSTFGSWRDGLQAIDLEPISHTLSNADITDELRRVAAELDHSPSVREMAEHGSIAPSTVENHFGSWNDGLEAAGLATTMDAKATKTEVIDAIQALTDQLSRPPTATEMDNRGKFSTAVAQRRFGDWNSALQAAGYEPHTVRDIPDEMLLEEISRLADTLGHPPSSIEMGDYGQYSLRPYRRSFDSWRDAVETAGYEYRGQPQGSNHRRWKGGHGDISYGPNWHSQRKRVLKRDDFQCRMLGCGIDRERHRDLYGRDLHVHHIMPIRSFIDDAGVLDYDRANRLDNLATLCHCHHQYWEQIAPLTPDFQE